ncbi:hypothetical protein GCM10025868_24820 [Angustibacter aerolatus]|uniref:Uncharacterized protein n=1 Tax=Angustibacter aerolatus TaxID=1162965 RepID=A0ABQ6JHL4_9ACTN|nr:hypothetical protein GCM10025868_24820 [Angustibacter aerolatus]
MLYRLLGEVHALRRAVTSTVVWTVLWGLALPLLVARPAPDDAEHDPALHEADEADEPPRT